MPARPPLPAQPGSPPAARRPSRLAVRLAARLLLLPALSPVAGGCDTGAAALDGGSNARLDADEAAEAHLLEIAEGGRSARSRGCTSCHDAGDGRPAGRLLALPGTRAFPSNLTSDLDTGLGGWTDEQIALAIHDGVDDEGRPLCGVMPRYDTIDPAELHALVTWIRALPPVHREVPPSECAERAVDGGGARDAGSGGGSGSDLCGSLTDAAAAGTDVPDLRVPPDVEDLRAVIAQVDLCAPLPDLAAPVDLQRPPDLVTPVDLVPPVDLVTPVDLAAPPDLTTRADLAPGPCGVRINEVQTAGAGGATDEFIELVNPCPAPIDLDGMQLVYRAAAGIADVVLLRLPVFRLASSSRLLLGSAGYTGLPDLRYGGALASDGGGLALRDLGGQLGDHLGWGTARNAYVRGTPAPAPPPTLAIGRHPDGADSGDDLRDFRVDLPTPGRANR